VANAFGSLTLDPLDLPKADSADTARIREVAEAQSAQILALEEIGDSAEDCIGRELLTTDPMDQFWNPYSYVGGSPLMGADPEGLEAGVCADAPVVIPGSLPQYNTGTFTLPPLEDIPGPGISPTPNSGSSSQFSYLSNWAITPQTGLHLNTQGQYPNGSTGHQAGQHSAGLRMPDFVAVNLNIAIPNPYTLSFVGWSGTISVDRYGHLFFSPTGGGVGKSATIVSGSVTANWMNSRTKPTASALAGILSKHGLNVTAGFWGGVSESWSPGSGSATGFGFVSPQFGGSYNYSFQKKGSTGGTW
jgi:hypothetical protein